MVGGCRYDITLINDSALPTAFMTGIVGKFFVQFGWSAAIAVFFSLVVARLITPMMAAISLKPIVDAHREAAWERWYMKLAQWSLTHRLKTFWVTMLFFLLCCLVDAVVANRVFLRRTVVANPNHADLAARKHALSD